MAQRQVKRRRLIMNGGIFLNYFSEEAPDLQCGRLFAFTDPTNTSSSCLCTFCEAMKSFSGNMLCSYRFGAAVYADMSGNRLGLNTVCIVHLIMSVSIACLRRDKPRPQWPRYGPKCQRYTYDPTIRTPISEQDVYQ